MYGHRVFHWAVNNWKALISYPWKFLWPRCCGELSMPALGHQSHRLMLPFSVTPPCFLMYIFLLEETLSSPLQHLQVKSHPVSAELNVLWVTDMVFLNRQLGSKQMFFLAHQCRWVVFSMNVIKKSQKGKTTQLCDPACRGPVLWGHSYRNIELKAPLRQGALSFVPAFFDLLPSMLACSQLLMEPGEQEMGRGKLSCLMATALMGPSPHQWEQCG